MYLDNTAQCSINRTLHSRPLSACIALSQGRNKYASCHQSDTQIWLKSTQAPTGREMG